jgi:cytidylate kinase
MPVIAMTQEMGSLAKDVALQLADTLGLAVMRHEVVEHVAERMNVHKSLISRLRGGKAGLVERLTTDRHSVEVFTAEELFALADRGNVVLRGWGATALLRPVPHVLCVRITRPLHKRVEWLMSHMNTDDRALAEAEVRRSDNAHASRMNAQFGVTWGDPLLYDLVLNTDRISVAGCVDLIRQAVGRPEFAETPESHALLADMALAARVRAALHDAEATRGIRVTVAARSGRIALRGIVVDDDERALSVGVAGSVPGVIGIDDELKTMAAAKKFPAARF